MNPVLVRDILTFLNQWAPPALKMDWDNVGLLVGDRNTEVNGILTALDVTEAVVEEAIEGRFNLIVSHHPLIFGGLHSIDPTTRLGSILYRLIRNEICVISVHTNLDAALDGVSFALANHLGLDDLSFLERSAGISRKIRLTTAHSNPEEVLKLISYYSGEEAHYWELDGTVQGLRSYEAILDRHQVPGLYRGLEKEGLLKQGMLQEVPLENATANFGMGVVGHYPEPGISMDEFLHLIASTLGQRAIRHSGSVKRIRKVAVCGGSGAFLRDKARRAGVDAYVTADLKYHDFFMEAGDFLLVDIGHYESEVPIVEALRTELHQAFEGVKVASTNVITNPIHTTIPNLNR